MISFMRFIKQKGKAHIEKNRVKNNPNIKNSMESIPQIIQSASLTVISQSMPSRLSSKIKPNGDLNERQKKKKKSAKERDINNIKQTERGSEEEKKEKKGKEGKERRYLERNDKDMNVQ